jgi:alpha-tubulin suppressor-like RCC1 family protein
MRKPSMATALGHIFGALPRSASIIIAMVVIGCGLQESTDDDDSSDITDPEDYMFPYVSAGVFHTCVVNEEKQLSCFGDNSVGQLEAPHGEYVYVATGSGASCAINVDRNIVCWGEDAYGIEEVPEGEFVKVAMGEYHACALTEDGEAVCWGQNTNGQCDAQGVRLIDVDGGARNRGHRNRGQVDCCIVA